jgi:hypothetical protein
MRSGSKIADWSQSAFFFTLFSLSQT